MHVYLNAHPIAQSDSRQKQKPTNELVPTVIPYAGELMEFAVDMGFEVRYNRTGNFSPLIPQLFVVCYSSDDSAREIRISVNGNLWGFSNSTPSTAYELLFKTSPFTGASSIV